MSVEIIYYHYAPNVILPGGVIEMGNFGRILKKYSSNSFNLMFVREYIFEAVRQQKFPEKTSRMSALFAFETIDEAKLFQQKNPGFETCALHAVRSVESAPSIHRGCYTLPNPAAGIWDGFERLAEEYWGTLPTECIEIVIQSNVIVVDVIDR